jgi:hypothetical protein
MSEFKIDVDPANLPWRDAEDGGLICTLNIGGYCLHLEAWREHRTKLDIQHFKGRDEDVDRIAEAVGGDGPWTTFERRGKRYVMVATPFCD